MCSEASSCSTPAFATLKAICAVADHGALLQVVLTLRRTRGGAGRLLGAPIVVLVDSAGPFCAAEPVAPFRYEGVASLEDMKALIQRRTRWHAAAGGPRGLVDQGGATLRLHSDRRGENIFTTSIYAATMSGAEHIGGPGEPRPPGPPPTEATALPPTPPRRAPGPGHQALRKVRSCCRLSA